jgi:SAM-dependent methyltransferase
MQPGAERIAHGRAAYFSKQLAERGVGPQGVGWNSTEAQEVRFAQLVKVFEGAERPISINDYGCGVGALASYLTQRGEQFSYTGFDLSESMIAQATELHGASETIRFTTREEGLEPADFTICSGLFNNRLDAGSNTWQAYVLEVIDRLAEFSEQGFAFNMLTSYSDPEHLQDDLYYGDPRFFFDHCVRRFSRKVALLHDYELFDFTVLVRLA